MKDKLGEILTELVNKSLYAEAHQLRGQTIGIDEFISQAKAQILSLIRSCVPKKKEIEGRLIIDGLHRVYWDGFNSACDLMDKNIEGL